MTDYISREAIGLTDFEIIMCQKGNPYKNALEMLMDKIENLPAADVRPVVRGKWIYDIEPDMFRCSECNGFAPRNDYPFCHWCGADMRGEQT